MIANHNSSAGPSTCSHATQRAAPDSCGTGSGDGGAAGAGEAPTAAAAACDKLGVATGTTAAATKDSKPRRASACCSCCCSGSAAAGGVGLPSICLSSLLLDEHLIAVRALTVGREAVRSTLPLAQFRPHPMHTPACAPAILQHFYDRHCFRQCVQLLGFGMSFRSSGLHLWAAGPAHSAAGNNPPPQHCGAMSCKGDTNPSPTCLQVYRS